MWFYYALFFAIWGSIQTLIVKKYLSKNIEPLVLTYVLLLFGFVCTFILLQFVGGIPNFTPVFIFYVACSAALDSVAFFYSFKAIEITDISILAPIASFGPVFTAIIAMFTLGEALTPLKFGGVLLVVGGSYLLNVSEIGAGILAPFKKLFSNRGVLFFLLSNLLWAITPIFQKKAIFETHPQTPLFVSVAGAFIVVIILSVFALKRTLSNLSKLSKHIKWFAIYGVGGAFAQFAAFSAFAIANLAYVTPVMRLSGVFTIILGGTVLKEKKIGERLLGAVVMLVGVLIIVV